MTKAAQPEVRYAISEAAPLLDRSMHTLRSWDRKESMPVHLRPKRDANGNRYWTPELIEQIKVWIEENDFHPGRGIDYHPNEKQLKQHIKLIRRSTQAKKNAKVIPHEAELRDAVTTAVANGMDKDRIITMLPNLIPDNWPGLKLSDALRIVAGIFSESE